MLMMDSNLFKKIEKLPSSPGVYFFLNAKRKTIYIGKAKSLKHRVRSYFQNSSNITPKIRQMVSEISHMEFIVTSSELEALILEGNLIKKEKPKYNVVLRDDKNFPYLKLTIKERYPRVVLVRRAKKDGNLYYGPYLPAKVARHTLKMIPKFFKVAVCSRRIDTRKRKPCLYYQLDQCLAPCEGNMDRKRYLRAVEEVKLFLEGKNRDLIANLKEKMSRASKEQQYESAASYRDTISTIEALSKKQPIISVGLEDQDYFAHHREGDKCAIQVFQMRAGKIRSRRQFTFDAIHFEGDSIYPAILPQYYFEKSRIPDSIYIQESFEERALIENMLSHVKGKKVHIISPSRGLKKDFLQTVKRNARLLFEERFPKKKGYHVEGWKELEKIAETSLRRVEAFDVSHLQGSDAVASVIVFEDGRPSKKDYRRFKIKSFFESSDDYASLSEAVERRYTRQINEKKRMPDFILIDGGKGQLSAALLALSRIGAGQVMVGAIEKQEEKLFLPNRKAPLRLNKSSAALNLLRRIRDEAHRFALSYHRKLRAKRTLQSELIEIPGIGEKTAQKLLSRFGSVKEIKQMSLEEVTGLVSEKLAKRIIEHFHEPHRSD